MTLANYAERNITLLNRTRQVYVTGSGPAVIVMHELPGMTPECLELGNRLAAAGYTSYLPLFFGVPGQHNNTLRNLYYAARFCISREWQALAVGKTSPVADWVRELCGLALEECGGPGVGAIGMCMTGSFVIPLVLSPALLAPVVCQPALPFGFTRRQKSDLGVSSVDLLHAQQRMSQQNMLLIGFRFSGDRISPREKFETLRSCFAERFEGHEISSEPGNAHQIPPRAHSVLTEDYRDTPGHPTRVAFERVLEFFGDQLKPGAT